MIIFLLSGFLLVFCCHLQIVQAENQKNDSCPLAKISNSCKKADNSQSFSIEADSDLDCCKILSQVFDKTRKVEKIQKAGTTAEIIEISASAFTFVRSEFKQSKVFQTFISNRAKTHLKNCVFRI